METVTEWFLPVNAPFTIFLIACGLYWVLVITGFFGLDMFDLDLDLDVDVDIDSPDISDVGSIGLVSGFMRFLHFHEVPFMVVLSIFSMVLWIFAVLLNHHWNPEQSWTIVAIGIVPTILAALAFSKIAVQPFAYFFRRAVVEEKKLKDYVGEKCVVMTSSVTDKFGQAEIATGESPLIIQIRNLTEFQFSKGDIVLLAKYVQAGRYFEIRPVTKAELSD